MQLHERVGDAPLGDLEDRGFGAVERLVDVVLGRVRHLLDVARGLDQPPQHRELGDDLRVVRRVRRRGRRRLDPQQRLAAAELRRAATARRSSSATVTGSTGSPRLCRP